MQVLVCMRVCVCVWGGVLKEREGEGEEERDREEGKGEKRERD